MSKAQEAIDRVKEKLEDLWNGDVKLAQTFWLYYILVLVVLRILALFLGQVIGVLALLWAGFMVIPIWRAANKYSGNNLNAILAKSAAVLIAIFVLVSLV